MATTLLPSSTLKLPRPNPSFPTPPRRVTLPKPHAPPRASADEDSTTSSTSVEPKSDQDDSFESRLSKVRLRYPSRTEERAAIKKAKKASKKPGSSVFLPPVPLKEPISNGLPVEFGFSPYSERVNGRIAILGLTALLAVELATGTGVINYHSPSIVLIQIYFVAAVSALYIKLEKERNSVWPDSQN